MSGLLVMSACTAAPLSSNVPPPAGATSSVTNIAFTNENWALAVAEPEKYVGSPVTLTGRVFLAPERTADQVSFQMFADPANSTQNTVVAGLPPATAVKQGDYVRVEGEVFTGLTGANLLGGLLNLPRIRAKALTKITRAEAVAPTLREIAVGEKIKQHAITITLQKVEFANSETRLFVRIENAGPAKASVFAFNAVVVQGTRQLEPSFSFDKEYPDIPSPMLAGVVVETALIFERLEVGPMRFVWSASSDNFSQRFKDYVWDVKP